MQACIFIFSFQGQRGGDYRASSLISVYVFVVGLCCISVLQDDAKRHDESADGTLWEDPARHLNAHACLVCVCVHASQDAA
jgi:hypothetical protein